MLQFFCFKWLFLAPRLLSGMRTIDHMNATPKILAATGSALLLSLTSLQALPTLQLDIGGGTYVGGSDETTYANANPFTLYALLNGPLVVGKTYYISAAIEPLLAQGNPPPNVGTFSVNGTVYSTANMAYGIPPIAVADNPPSGNLAQHGQYPTYYAEIAFTFSGTQSGLYNTQEDPGDPLSHPGTGLYYEGFNVNVSSLFSSYSVHFDLYDVAVKNGSFTVDDFAPFSHDAQSGSGGGGHDDRVPDGGTTVAMLGLALAGLGATRRFLKR